MNNLHLLWCITIQNRFVGKKPLTIQEFHSVEITFNIHFEIWVTLWSVKKYILNKAICISIECIFFYISLDANKQKEQLYVPVTVLMYLNQNRFWQQAADKEKSQSFKIQIMPQQALMLHVVKQCFDLVSVQRIGVHCSVIISIGMKSSKPRYLEVKQACIFVIIPRSEKIKNLDFLLLRQRGLCTNLRTNNIIFWLRSFWL